MENDVGVALRTAATRMFRDAPLGQGRPIVLPPDHSTFMGTLSQFANVIHVARPYFYPLVILPLTVKAYGLVPPIQEVFSKAAELMSQAEEVFLVGYRAADQIVRELLANPPTREGTFLHVVSLNEASAREIMDRVAGFAPSLRRGEIYDGGFMRFVRDIL